MVVLTVGGVGPLGSRYSGIKNCIVIDLVFQVGTPGNSELSIRSNNLLAMMRCVAGVYQSMLTGNGGRILLSVMQLPFDINSRNQELLKLWVAHQPTVSAFLGSLLRNFSETEELLQETAVQVFGTADRYDPTRPFLPWCLGIAQNVVLKHRRRQVRENRIFSKEAIENLVTAFEQTCERQEQLGDALERCRGKLTLRSKELCSLRYENGLSLEEIAITLKTTPGTISNALYRIRDQLRDCIELRLRAARVE